MPHRGLSSLLAWWLTATATLPALAPAPDPVTLRRDADLLKRKVVQITQQGTGVPSDRLQRTTLSQAEINAYLATDMLPDLPAGVLSPEIELPGGGRVSGRAIVDLDQIRGDRKPTSLFDPIRYLTGRLPVTATGTLRSGNGVATFQLESAELAGVPIPKTLLQQIVSYYSRSSTRPSGFSLDDPVVLPARIREIELQPGQAIVIQ
jgi:hypothetical protein